MIFNFKGKIQSSVFIDNLLAKSEGNILIIRPIYYKEIKKAEISLSILNLIIDKLESLYGNDMTFKMIMSDDDGPITFVVINKDSFSLKHDMSVLEDEDELGMLGVFMVYDKVENRFIKRSEANSDYRVCPICHNEEYINCDINKKHSRDKIVKFLSSKYSEIRKYFFSII
ncbi:citrate lyase holo-[acyl-carrier protein] synthase [Candidatus Arthromitus sp. SFB-rat-Yit]|uniref:citrate lyase holo-[acyl-carrier protein] synthase n=1 Tax=Candidatus Arthromitus sp. SFB-rat-Yit TaxID=1041504 RepID=UPI000227A78A|nr:citrate lyase holo-[acyl-carrier protein] synthase [Candidatus Arthromitus sp. SFB-rat-Yit]BAK81750.1 putative citX protein [Candidatus Arthromitus sp. SFB-rat-Yit]